MSTDEAWVAMDEMAMCGVGLQDLDRWHLAFLFCIYGSS